MKEYLSKRGQSLASEVSPLVYEHFRIQDDQYHPEKNPDGHINMGTAETHLINDEMLAVIKVVQARVKLEPRHLHYDYLYGGVSFRTEIARHWQHLIFGAESVRKISADHIVVGAGCSLALEMLATMLGDPGDVVLVPAPYYSGFIDDFSERAKIGLVGVHCGADLPKEAFEKAYAEQTAAGKAVRAVLFSSPNNPTGAVYTKEAIQGLLSFCMEKDIDVISDEIYAETIHDPAANWVSTLQLTPDAYLHRVHVTSSFAKDFALSGFRTGFAISFNPALIQGMRGLAYYSVVSNYTQAFLEELLRAPELPAILRKNREQLRTAYTLIKSCMQDIGVEILPAQGGIFVFANFASYMAKNEFAAEYTLWQRIRDELKINISPGQLFDAAEPGWFRVCFAHDPAVVTEACRRLRTLKR